MNIRIKGIAHERTEDAPFMGALISAIDCHIDCKGCFNQHLKNESTIILDSKTIIREVLKNPFNKGIILGGLEWTEQPEEMKELIKIALENDLQVILYTGLNENVFNEKFPDVCQLNIYIKYGNYDEKNKAQELKYYEVKMASENQKISKCGDKI